MELVGKLLIAMPGMGDPRFDRSLVYMCAHSDEGGMGLIINKPMTELKLSALLKQLDIERAPDMPDRSVVFGGPVETARGFVLHSRDYAGDESTLFVDDGLGMTATQDVLRAVAGGYGPERFIMALGYSGWAKGQLEAEISRNGWLTCEASEELIFETAPDLKWEAALKTLGVDPLVLSAASGRA